MEENNKIVGLKHIKIKWMSENSFTLDDENMGQIDVDAFYYNDDTIIGKVEYPFSIVVGKYIENMGTYFVILDEETNRFPHTVIAAIAKDGNPNTFYGSITPLDGNDPDKILDNAWVTVTSENLKSFEQESSADVLEKIIYGIDLICSSEFSANLIMYNGITATNYDKYIEYINDFKLMLNKAPFLPIYEFLDTIEFQEFDD